MLRKFVTNCIFPVCFTIVIINIIPYSSKQTKLCCTGCSMYMLKRLFTSITVLQLLFYELLNTGRKFIPIFCFHQINNYQSPATVKVSNFTAFHMLKFELLKVFLKLRAYFQQIEVFWQVKKKLCYLYPIRTHYSKC